jgi:hypothetical protein
MLGFQVGKILLGDDPEPVQAGMGFQQDALEWINLDHA